MNGVLIVVLIFNNKLLFTEGKVNIVEKSLRQSQGDYSTIFTEPEENNCFSIIPQVIIRVTVFSFILLVSSLKKINKLCGGHCEN